MATFAGRSWPKRTSLPPRADRTPSRSARSPAGSRYHREEPNLLATAFLPIPPPGEIAEEPNPWGVLAAALDELVGIGAMPIERRAGAETIAWSAVHGFAILRAGRAFDVSGEPDPDPEAVLDAIARSLKIEAS